MELIVLGKIVLVVVVEILLLIVLVKLSNYLYGDHHDMEISMNKYFLSQIIYDRFKLYTDKKDITTTMDKLRKEVSSKDISQSGLKRVLKRNVNSIFKIL